MGHLTAQPTSSLPSVINMQAPMLDTAWSGSLSRTRWGLSSRPTATPIGEVLGAGPLGLHSAPVSSTEWHR